MIVLSFQNVCKKDQTLFFCVFINSQVPKLSQAEHVYLQRKQSLQKHSSEQKEEKYLYLSSGLCNIQWTCSCSSNASCNKTRRKICPKDTDCICFVTHQTKQSSPNLFRIKINVRTQKQLAPKRFRRVNPYWLKSRPTDCRVGNITSKLCSHTSPEDTIASYC